MSVKIATFILYAIKKHINFHIKKKPGQFSDFSGLWKDYNISIKTIRKKAWK
jgi:hypothetical protein